MKKNEMKNRKLGLNLIKVIGYKAAKYTANVACTYVLYQPEVPECVKKLRKF